MPIAQHLNYFRSPNPGLAKLAQNGARHSDGSLRFARVVVLISTVLWALVVATGLWWLTNYKHVPGIAASPPAEWPTTSRIRPATDGLTLVMVAHPHCPCTRASIDELAAIMAHSQGRLRAYVLFTQLEGSSGASEEMELWQSAAKIPGVIVLNDDAGNETHIFNAATSGQTVLYNPEGRLLFSGGITESRGHSGDNAGERAIVALLNNEVPDRAETSVFGCPLYDPESECPRPTDGPNKH